MPENRNVLRRAIADVPDINVGNILFMYTLYEVLQTLSPQNFIAVFHKLVCIFAYIPFDCSCFNIEKCGNHVLGKADFPFKHNAFDI